MSPVMDQLACHTTSLNVFNTYRRDSIQCETVSKLHSIMFYRMFKTPDMHWTVSMITAEPANRPGVLQVGHQADMQWDWGRLAYRSLESLPKKTNRDTRGCKSAHV